MNTCDHYNYVMPNVYVKVLKNVFATVCLRFLRVIRRPDFTVKHSYHFQGGLLVELQFHVNQNKTPVGFLKLTFYSMRKVTSLLDEKSAFLPLL